MKTRIYVVVGAFGGVIDEVVVDADEAAAQAHYQRLCSQYGFDPVHASESEHDVELVSAEIVLPGLSLTGQQVARLAFEAVELMGDVLYDPSKWEPYTCEGCDKEYWEGQATALETNEEHRPLCPHCGQPLTSADERIRQIAEGAVQYAIEAALRAERGQVNHPNQGTVSDAFLDRLVAWVTAHETPEQIKEGKR